MYAVKANPSPDLLRVLYDSGITHYDVASIAEVRLARETLPEATLCFMHPVKTRAAIREAYFEHGVKTFSLDHIEELEKIVECCRGEDGEAASDLRLLVRLRVSSDYSELSLASKFGVDLADAAPLLQATRQHCDWLGVCFHVGSQAMTPFAYVQALERVKAAVAEAGVVIDMVDVGGGFPSVYPGMEPPPLEDYFAIIHKHFEALPIAYNAELWCEPGRALCAEYSSMIVRATKGATDLRLCVRLRVSSEYSELSLAAKFGVDLADAAPLLQATRQHCDWLGVCFHVGSQAMTPFAYVQALERVKAAVAEAGVVIDMVDVGGGFPSVYPGMEPPPLEDYFAIIHKHFEALPIAYNAELWCEPGRALCAEYSSMIVRVEKRRGNELYINDGAYGALFDAAHVGWRFPVASLEEGREGPQEDFAFFGPTCDDIDFMQGPFQLPGDIKSGDYIEIGMLGAYGAAMKTGFNGFGNAQQVVTGDEPMASLYRGDREVRQSDNVVSLR